mgnify:CR=1 FL=1|jgi:hypothetical protein
MVVPFGGCCGWFLNLVHLLELEILGTVSWPADRMGKAKWDGPISSSRWIRSEIVLEGHL